VLSRKAPLVATAITVKKTARNLGGKGGGNIGIHLGGCRDNQITSPALGGGVVCGLCTARSRSSPRPKCSRQEAAPEPRGPSPSDSQSATAARENTPSIIFAQEKDCVSIQCTNHILDNAANAWDTCDRSAKSSPCSHSG
jgi:hypothetical protein